MSEREHAEERLAGSRLLERMNLIWALIFYISLGLGLPDVLATRRGAGLAGTLALLVASAALFQGLYWRVFSGAGAWPMPRRAAWGYFGGQLAILAALLIVDQSFVGLGFALMGQAYGALRPRHWPLPILPLFALLAWRFGWLANLAQIDWLNLAVFLLVMAIWLIIALLIAQLFHQRHRLLALVRELRQAKAQLEAGVAQQEELAVLRERTRLAREMHDNLGHALVSVNVKLEAAQRLYRVDPARGDAELEATRALVRESMSGLRRSLGDLRAPLPDRGDLPAALRRLAAEVSGRGAVAVAVAGELDGAPAPPAVAEGLLLIAREALANVERHARAARAHVTLGRGAGGWHLDVCDDGVGVRPADLRKRGHFGVVGMHERAGALGGTLSVAARPEGGTLVAVAIPDGGASRP